jgi:glycosyltransferase involved in cell wall biosynthesis
VDKFEGLAAMGMRVTIAATGVPRRDSLLRPGLELVEVPAWDEPPARLALATTLSSLRVAIRSPRALLAAVRCARRPLRRSTRPRPLAFLARLRAYLPLATLRPDVVHFEWNSAAIQFLPLAPVWGCPTVVSCHGSEVNVRAQRPGQEAFARALRASFARVSAIHCVSHATAASAIGCGAEVRKISLIRPGVDATSFVPSGRRRQANEPLRVVCVGALRSIKGHAYAIRAIRRLLESNVPATLQIIGGDPSPALGEPSVRGAIERELGERLLIDCVRLRGKLSRSEIRSVLAASDVLLHLSLSEGFSVALIEAMACGLPVVVSDHAAAREALDDGVHGFVVPLEDPTSAAAALRVLYRDRQLAERMGAAGRARVVERFTLAQHLESFLGFYEQLRARGASAGDGAHRVHRTPGRADELIR